MSKSANKQNGMSMSNKSESRIRELTGMPLINFNSKPGGGFSESRTGLWRVAHQQYLAYYQQQVSIIAAALHGAQNRLLFSLDGSISEEEGSKYLPTDLLDEEDELEKEETEASFLSRWDSVGGLVIEPPGKLQGFKPPLRKSCSWTPDDRSFRLFPTSPDPMSEIRKDLSLEMGIGRLKLGRDNEEEDSNSSSGGSSCDIPAKF